MILAVLREFGLLTESEAEQFMDQFAQYLAQNGLKQQDWDRISKDDPEVAEKILHLFTMSALGDIMGRLECMELRTKAIARFVSFHETELEMISVSTTSDICDLTLNLTAEDIDACELSLSRRNYEKSKLADILTLASSGYRPCKLEIFQNLKSRI